MKLFNRFLKTILLFLFMPPLIAFASCVEADAVKLMKENLTPRIQFLRQENVLPTFQEVTEEKEKPLIRAYEKKDWEGVCRGSRNI